MRKEWQGKLALDIREAQPDWTPFIQPEAPRDAPNVLMIVWDDVGYAAMDIHGGPIETPNMRRIADNGVKYSNFHTTALCSPTRSSLLTGRNATSNGMACVVEGSAGFPGLCARIPFENGTIAEVLNEMGWNTYAIGKWHLTPADETNNSSWKARWPTGRGFERFYGFLGGETNQWYPDLVYDNHDVEQPAKPDWNDPNSYHLSKDLVDKAIEFVKDSKSVAPDKPWFMYFCPGCAHAPHHVFKEWADKYKGRFDMGYEAIREQILENQKKMGLLPQNTELSPINPHGEPNVTGPDGQPWPQMDFVKPWDSLSDDEKKLFCRMAEVYAGFVSYTDDQIGRLLEYLEKSGQMDNTIIVVTSDNGASGEGGPNGSYNENRFMNNVSDTIEDNMKFIDVLGSPKTYNHYNTGWAWAFDTPFPYWKRFSGYEGGVSDICLISWPRGIKAKGEVRNQYVHAVDIVPTLYELMGVTPPDEIKGYQQNRIEGESFKESLTDPKAPEKETQFYAMLGQRSVYHQGWLCNTLHPPISGWGHFDDDVWELYNLKEDRSQKFNLAGQNPEKVRQMKDMWVYLASQYAGIPLDDRSAMEIFVSPRPQPSEPRGRYLYYPNSSPVPESVAVDMRARSYTIAAGVIVDTPESEGVLFAFGSSMGGHSLYIQNKKLTYVYNWLGSDIQKVVSGADITTGRHILSAEFRKIGEDPKAKSPTGVLTLYIDNKQVGQDEIKAQPGNLGIDAYLMVGYDKGAGVSPDYETPFAFTGGTIEEVIVDVSGERYIDAEKQVMAWVMKD